MKTVLKDIALFIFAITACIQINGQTQNYLTSSGNKLYDVSGDEVRLTGVNWFGFETALYSPHGIWTRDMKSVLQQIKNLGFNTVRVPWCNEMLDPGASVSINSYGTDAYSGVSPMNAEEATATTPIELLDIFVDWCQENDMKIVLDNHSRAADAFLVEGSWFTDEYSEERWINDWMFLAERYKGKSAVVAMDLNNEPHGSTWGNSNPSTDWNKAAERCGNAVLSVNPDVLIIVEGVGEFEGDSYWWGGQLMGAASYPVVLSDPSKLVYSAHEYGPEVSQQDWFEDPTFPNNMPQIWEDHFDYLYESETSPIFVGEFGIKNQDAFDGIAYTWFTEYMDFMGDRYSWTFWSMNPNSGDTGGILQDDWTSVNQWKLDVLIPHIAPVIPNVIGGDVVVDENRAPIASFIGFNEPCENSRIVFLDASLSSDPDGDSLTYTWDFGDGSTGSGITIDYEYDEGAEDTVSITLTVSDGELSDSLTNDVNIEAGDCADPTIETLDIVASVIEGEAPLSVNFDGVVTMSAGNESDVDFTWDYGNGNFGTGQSTSETFTEEGTYLVVLTAVAEENTMTESIEITVNEAAVIESDLVVNYREAGSNPTNNSINPHFEIINNGGNSINYEDLSIRYYFTTEGISDFNFWCDWAQLGTSNVQGSFGEAFGMNFIEITFLSSAGSLSGNASSGNIQTRFAKTDWSNFEESNDYSYDGNKLSLTPHEQITLYQNGSLVWGVEPINNSSVSFDTSSFSIFPNQFSEVLSIESDNDLQGSVITLSNLQGEELQNIEVNESTSTQSLDISNLNAGIYILNVSGISALQNKMIVIE